MRENKSPFLDMANAISALRLELPESVWKDVAAKWANVVNTINTPPPEVGKTMAELVYKCVSAENYERWNTGARDGVLKAMSEWASLQCEAKDAEIKELRFMIDNGLGWEDMKNDITYPSEK